MPSLLFLQIYILTKEEGGHTKPLLDNTSSMIYSLTWNAPGTADMTESAVGSYEHESYDRKSKKTEVEQRKMIMPGEDASLIFNFTKPMPFDVGQRFTMRLSEHTIGTGIVTKLLPDE